MAVVERQRGAAPHPARSQGLLDLRESFWEFRQQIHPGMKRGWWQQEIAGHLQQFAEDLFAGRRPKLVIQAPPQHGKSEQILDFIAWMAGRDPACRVIYASFSERLGVRANLMLRRTFESPRYQQVFPNGAAGTARSLRNHDIIEYVGHEGYFRNTTVRGSITGEALDLGIIDDPIKGREDAGSPTIRDKTWDWLTDDFFSRFSEGAGLLCILTRWHLDDPIGRLIAAMPDVKVVSHAAIAIRDEPHRKAGEPLFPEHKSLDFLLERKAIMAASSWEALYQQNPQVIGGEILRGAWFGRYSVPPPLRYRKIFADTAQKTAEHNDYSVFECWGLGENGKLYLLDLIRGKWEAPDLKRQALDFWIKHQAAPAGQGALREMVVEEQSSGTGLIQEIKRCGGFPVRGIGRTADKRTRIMDVVGYIESGYLLLPEEAPWVSAFLAECEAFTADDSHAHDDQVDPMADAISDLLAKKIRGWFL